MKKRALNNNPYSNSQFCEFDEFIATLALARSKNIGPVTFLKLYSRYRSPLEMLSYVKSLIEKKGDENIIPSKGELLKEIESTKASGADIISIFDEKYPEQLAKIEDPPIIISYKGDIKKITADSIAIVGSRNCSGNSLSLTYKIAKELSEAGFNIVSGLAKGIDAAAHKGVFDAEIDYQNISASTIGVIGSGIDYIYPKENKPLYEQMYKRGVVISEYPYRTAPKSENFPRRNRIISALSKIVIVAEAAFKSGSLITARMALEQGKEIFAVPGFPLDPRSAGTNNLIKNGANIFTKTSDVVNLMEDINLRKINSGDLFLFKEEKVQEKTLNFDPVKEDFDKNKLLMNNLSFSPIDIDLFITQTGVSAADVSSFIIENEILGILQRHPGNKISKVA